MVTSLEKTVTEDAIYTIQRCPILTVSVYIKFDNKIKLKRNILSDKKCKEHVDKNIRYIFDAVAYLGYDR